MKLLVASPGSLHMNTSTDNSVCAHSYYKESFWTAHIDHVTTVQVDAPKVPYKCE